MTEQRPTEQFSQSAPAETAPVAPQPILEGLRSGDARRSNAAAEQLRADLRPAIIAMVGATGRGDIEADSVLNSVLCNALPKARERCTNDADLKGYLYRSADRKKFDRLRKRRPDQLPEYSSSNHDPADDQQGPATEAMAHSELQRDADSASVFESLLAGAVDVTPRERQLVDLYVVRGMSWEEVCAIVPDENPNKAKVALSRARKRLLPQVLEPMKARLSSANWTILEGILIEGADETTLAARLSLTAGELRDRFAFEVAPALRKALGATGVDALRRLARHPNRRPAKG